MELLAAVTGPVGDHDRERVERMNGLTRGDFAAALRRLALLGERVDSGSLVRALADEWGMKKRESRTVAGFRTATPNGDAH